MKYLLLLKDGIRSVLPIKEVADLNTLKDYDLVQPATLYQAFKFLHEQPVTVRAANACGNNFLYADTDSLLYCERRN